MVKFSIQNATAFSNLVYGRDEMLKAARIIEELGNYSMLTVMDHVNWYPDYTEIYSAWLMAAEIAMVTKRVGIGIMVSDVFRTHPVQMAQHALHMQKMSNNRFVLGIGAGEGPNLAGWGINADKPVSHMEEAIQVMKLVFESDPRNKVSFDGKYYKFSKQFLQFKRKADEPTVPAPKIWVAAGSPRTLKLTAKYADGWIPVGATPSLYKEQAAVVRSEGRPVELAYNAFINVSDKDPAAAKERMKYIGMVQCLRPEVMKACGIDVPDKVNFIKHFSKPGVSEHKRHQGAAMEYAMKANIPIEKVMEPVFAGSSDEVIGQIEKWVEAGCEHFMFQLFGDDYWGSLELLSKKVIPHFASK
ncbi:MAG: LLM class flavin-dependent oxidoreductase [Candidatus Lokiarchaeota archaeon]|nr:LLM class flavin-dependent oxidoreductase [Candidatus Lokiarchaeota archaeon]